MTKSESLHMDRVAQIGCVICRRESGIYVPCDLHHIAEGSGLRSNFAVAGLCGVNYQDHHDGRQTGGAGFHRMGKQWLKLFRVPGESEYGLLVMVNEDLARYS